jgi:hypothetical protein
MYDTWQCQMMSHYTDVDLRIETLEWGARFQSFTCPSFYILTLIPRINPRLSFLLVGAVTSLLIQWGRRGACYPQSLHGCSFCRSFNFMPWIVNWRHESLQWFKSMINVTLFFSCFHYGVLQCRETFVFTSPETFYFRSSRNCLYISGSRCVVKGTDSSIFHLVTFYKSCKYIHYMRCNDLYTPRERKEVVLRIFIAIKMWSSSTGFEPANLGSSSKYVNHLTTDGDCFVLSFMEFHRLQCSLLFQSSLWNDTSEIDIQTGGQERRQ